MGTRRKGFATEIAGTRKVALDSSILIYHLGDVAPYSDLTEIAFTRIAEGSIESILSTLSVTELLAKPFAEKRSRSIAVFEQFVFSIPQLTLIAPGYSIAKRAAQLRGVHHLRTPDALIFATALEEGADAFLTNDARSRKLGSEGIRILILDDYV